MKSYTFYNQLCPEIPIWERDIDRYISPNFINYIALKTNTSTYRIKQSLLSSYINKLFLYHNHKTISNWILPLGIYGKKRLRHGLSFCPSCLKKDKETPYYRKYWRLSLFTICPICGCLLYDACPNCDSPIVFYRLDLGNKFQFPEYKISYCHNCKFKLTRSPIIPASASMFNFQKSIFFYLQGKPTPFTQYSVLYFNGLNLLLGMLCSGRERIKSHQYNIWQNYNLTPIELKKGISSSFHWRRVNERHKVLTICADLLENWPLNLTNTLKKNDIYYSVAAPYQKNIPYWLFKVLKSI